MIKLVLKFGEKINLLCKKYKIMKKDLAREWEISATYLSDVIGGKYNPSPQLLEKIKETFSDDLEFLLEEAHRESLVDSDLKNKLPKELQDWIESNKDAAINYIYMAKTLHEGQLSQGQIQALISLLTELYVRLCEIYGHKNVEITPEYILKSGKRPDAFVTIRKGGRLYLYYVEIHISNNKFNIGKYESIYSNKLQEFPTLIIVTDQKLKLQTKLDHVIIGKDMQNIKSKVRVNSGIVGR